MRLIRACEALGIESVAVVSVADRNSLPARAATHNLCIGPAPALKSYMRPELILHAALSTGCDAIHPGYGFLSERPELPRMCHENGITFIGPTAEVIRSLGDKLEARRIAQEASVPLLPGSQEIKTEEEARRIAEQIGFPILIKASAGGGGRGMRIVSAERELKTALQTTASEARSAFGDPSLYIERFIANARHVEVQILGDGKGNVMHLGDRDCSLQRRHQKVIEEAPAPEIPNHIREAMYAASLRIASRINYLSAGTLEFLYDRDNDAFFFLEMNTRLQVEHPVTEIVTGIDIVATQLLIADGQSLPSQPLVQGHAIEARVAAEVPEEGFRPCPGTITRWEVPDAPYLRVDTYCEEGARIPPFYDSMIAKIIAKGSDRSHAIDNLAAALKGTTIEGIQTNRNFLLQLLESKMFQSMRHNTRSIDSSEIGRTPPLAV